MPYIAELNEDPSKAELRSIILEVGNLTIDEASTDGYPSSPVAT